MDIDSIIYGLGLGVINVAVLQFPARGPLKAKFMKGRWESDPEGKCKMLVVPNCWEKDVGSQDRMPIRCFKQHRTRVHSTSVPTKYMAPHRSEEKRP